MDEAAPQAARGNAGPEAVALTDAELGELLGSITVGMLRETFDEWTIGEAAGRFLAVRTGCFFADGPRSLIRGCVIAGTLEGLADQLGVQAWLESLPEAELAGLWRDGMMAGRA
jgi:hypothetical protein